MADVVGDAVIRIGADSSNFESELTKQTTKAGDSAAKSMVKKVGGVLATGFKVAATSAGLAAGATLGVALNKGFGRLTAIEDAESKLQVLLGSTQDVEKAMKAANAAVTGTAFGMGEAATATSNLIAANVPLDSVQRTLTLVADSATIGGTSLTEMSSIFAKVASDGKVSGEVLQQFGHRGVGVIKALADQLGVSQEAVRQMVSNGEIDFETFQAAMETMVGGAAQEAGKSVSGSMANVGAALSRLGAAMLEPVFERLPEVFTNLQTAIDNVTEVVKPLAERYGPLLGETLVRLSEWLVGVTQKVADLSAKFFGVQNAATEGLGAAAQPLESMREVLGGVFDAAEAVANALTGSGMADSLSGLSPIFSIIKAALPDIIEFGKQIGGTILSAVEALSPLLQASAEAFEQVGLALGGALMAALPGVSGALETLVTGLLPPLVELLLLVVPPVTDVVVWLINLAGALAGNEKVLLSVVGVLATVKLGFMAATLAIQAQALWTKIMSTEWLKNTAMMAKNVAVLVAQKTAQFAVSVASKAVVLGQYAMAAAQKVLNAVMKANPLGLVLTAVMALAAGIVYLWRNNETFRNIVMAVWEAIKNAIKAVADWFVDTVWPALKAAWEAIGDGFEWVRDTLSSAWTAIKDGISGAWEGIKSAVQKGIDFIVNLFMNFTGPGLIIKHWDTIKNGIDAAWTWIKDAAGKVFEWLKNLFFNFTGPGLIIKHWDTIKKAFSDAWTWISTVFKGLWDGLKLIVTTPIDLAKRGIDTLLSGIRWLFDKIWTWVSTTFKTLWNGFKSIITTPIDLAKRAIDTLLGAGSGIRSLFNSVWNWVKNTFQTLWNGFKSILTSPIDSAKTAIDTALDKIKEAFSKARDGIGSIWDGLKEKMRTPINWVIKNVINKLLGGVRPVLRAVGLEDLANKLKDMKEVGFAEGGWTGPGSKYQPAGIVHADEHVWTKAEMRRFPGGHAAMEAWRKAVLAGRIDAHLPGYARGGQVAPVPGPGRRHTSGYPWATWAGDYPVPMGTPIKAWKDGVVSLVKHLTTSYGKHVRINHYDGSSSLYAHMSKILTMLGAVVQAGTVIGRVGSTGNSTGPHLHFETMGAPFAAGQMQGSAQATTAIGDLIRAAAEPFLGKKVSGGGFIADFMNAIPKKLVDGIATKADQLFAKQTATAQGTLKHGVEMWKGVGIKALAMEGYGPELWASMARRMNQESGGNPRAINMWDINAKRGDPSRGLMQVIGSTFRAYARPGYNSDIYDPLSNILASIRYTRARYGSLTRGWDRPGGYLNGGTTSRVQMPWLSEDGRPELVVGPQRGRLKAGTRVYDGDETAGLMGPRTTITNNHITLQVDMSSVRDIRTLMEFLQRWELEAHRS